MVVAVLVASGVRVGVLAGASVGCGVRVGSDVARIGAGVAVLGALYTVAVVLGGSTAGVFVLSGVRSDEDATGCGAVVGRAVGVGELITGATGAAGTRIATGTTAGSIVNMLLSRSAASAAWALGGGIKGIVPISQA
jgi:hypothetical protein